MNIFNLQHNNKFKGKFKRRSESIAREIRHG